MKKVVIAMLFVAPPLALSAAAQTGGFGSMTQSGSGGTGSIKLDQAEYDDYTAAANRTDPAAKSAALEAFLVKYPNSSVKGTVLDTLVGTYQQANNLPKAVDAANRAVQSNPFDLGALVAIAGLDRYLAVNKNPPDQALLDEAAAAARKGLKAPKPMDVSAADFKKQQTAYAPIFDDAIGVDEQTKKDYPNAIRDLTQALKDTPEAQQGQGIAVQDIYLLAQSYIASTPANNLLGAYYYARLAALVPAQADFQKSAKYYYTKYHGKSDGYDDFQAIAKASLVPPADLTTRITPAPSPADIANQLVATTPQLDTLALSDREYILQNASADNADKMMAAIKGKAAEIAGIVISATTENVQLAVDDDHQAAKTADITIKMAEVLKVAPTVGSQQTYIATFDSYTKTPFMITMVDGRVKEKEKPVVKKPVAHRATH